MGRTRHRLVCSAVALASVAILLTLGVAAQTDPRNTSDEYFDAVNNAQCFEHHLEDGFNPFGFRFIQAYSQLPIGQEVDLQVQIRHDTDYKPHAVNDMSVTIDRSEARNVQVMTGDIPDKIEEDFAGAQTLSHGESISDEVFIGPGASGGILRARVEDVSGRGLPVGGADPGQLIVNADGLEGESQEGEVEIPLDNGFFQDRGRGNYTFEATWRSPYPPEVPVEAEVSMELEVFFEQEGTRFTFLPETPVLRQVGQTAVVTIPVRITSEEEAHLDFEIRAMAYFQHDKGDGAPRDDGDYVRFLTMDVEGGDGLVVARQLVVPAPVGPVVNVYNLMTRLLGFIGLFLVTAAMFTGGVFGKKSRRFMNRFAGGAKKRVLWHSSMGFLILVVATAHFSLALLETKHDLSRGLLWGGLAWVLLISLGFTGYYQVRMIKKWSYKRWRHVHLWSAVAVLLFVLLHATLDGADFKAVANLLPDWLIERLLWPTAP